MRSAGDRRLPCQIESRGCGGEACNHASFQQFGEAPRERGSRPRRPIFVYAGVARALCVVDAWFLSFVHFPSFFSGTSIFITNHPLTPLFVFSCTLSLG